MKILKALIIIMLFYLSFSISLFFYLGMDHNDSEVNNQVLATEFVQLLGEIEEYKQEHGFYPNYISDIQPNGKLCLPNEKVPCKKIYYRVTNKLDEFRLVIPTFTKEHVFFSQPDMNPNSQDISEKLTRHGRVCLPCEATLYPNKSFPRYKSDAKVFQDSEKYPDLPHQVD